MYKRQTVHTVDVGASLSKETKLLARLPRLKGGSNRCLVIASDPGQLYAISQRSFAFRRYGAIYGWVIDSFWDDRIPAVAKSSTYDRIFVADVDDVQPWTAAGVKNPGVLPWGADVWSAFSDRLAALESKSTDLPVSYTHLAQNDRNSVAIVINGTSTKPPRAGTAKSAGRT